MRRLLISSFVLAGTFAAAIGGAQAQQTSGPAMTAEEIAVCACQLQALEQQTAAMEIQRGLLDERQQELDALTSEIKRQARLIPENDTVGQALLQNLISQQIALRNLIQLRIRPDYNAHVRGVSEATTAYNAQCTTRPRYVTDTERAGALQSCPQ